jgi:4a-hydroxytetrahydrobiopterin dehydratase
MDIEKLSANVIEQELSGLSSWSLNDGKLYRQFVFENFIEAFGFMTRVAMLAESMDHHPEWSNVYNRVEIHLTTHDASGISYRDFELAEQVDHLLH